MATLWGFIRTSFQLLDKLVQCAKQATCGRKIPGYLEVRLLDRIWQIFADFIMVWSATLDDKSGIIRATLEIQWAREILTLRQSLFCVHRLVQGCSLLETCKTQN